MIQKSDYTLVQSADQPTWKILVAHKEVGKIWIHTEDTDELIAPSVFLEMPLWDAAIATAVLKEILRYAYGNLPYAELYARAAVSDVDYMTVLRAVGFETDEKPYTDEAGTQWQNVKLVL